jgi:hypothetical protein
VAKLNALLPFGSPLKVALTSGLQCRYERQGIVDDFFGMVIFTSKCSLMFRC